MRRLIGLLAISLFATSCANGGDATGFEPVEWHPTISRLVSPDSVVVPDSVLVGDAFVVLVPTVNFECKLGPTRVAHSEPLRYDIVPVDSVATGPILWLAIAPGVYRREVTLIADEPGVCRILVHAKNAEGSRNVAGVLERQVVIHEAQP